MLGKIRSEFKCLEGHCFNVSTCNRNDIIVVMVDLNAKVGNNNTDGEEVVETFDVSVITDEGERSCDIHNLT